MNQNFNLGFFYPIFSFLFAKEVFKKEWLNILFWILMYIGTSVMITLYSAEYYATILQTDNLIEQ
ncbi:unnamed protein product [Paramecium sonneborni]|uniref:Uncharacterized protein n=1 Tax=Paramecium sonneborni TaxID=65129 RepID=A0A8S1P3T3_9CILI|nr:unnamed protein product [Paramecium sonneborni]